MLSLLVGGWGARDAFTYLLVSPVPFTVDDISLVVCFQGEDFTLTETALKKKKKDLFINTKALHRFWHGIKKNPKGDGWRRAEWGGGGSSKHDLQKW